MGQKIATQNTVCSSQNEESVGDCVRNCLSSVVVTVVVAGTPMGVILTEIYFFSHHYEGTR